MPKSFRKHKKLLLTRKAYGITIPPTLLDLPSKFVLIDMGSSNSECSDTQGCDKDLYLTS